MEPLSIIAISAGVGGLAGKFVEKVWDSGEKWITSFFKDHGEKAQEHANINTFDFLNQLASRVKQLEESQQIPQEKIETAQDHPDFSSLLQKAILSASQTESKNKHALLARIVSERLKSEPETIFALSSKLACDAISYATVNQLLILGLTTNLYNIRPQPFPPMGIPGSQLVDWYDTWITARLKPYENIVIRSIDLNHLESLSCLKILSFVGRDINKIYSTKEFSFTFTDLKDTSLKEKIISFWNEHKLEQIDLTTVGQIIGVSVSDLLTNSTTSFVGWE